MKIYLNAFAMFLVFSMILAGSAYAYSFSAPFGDYLDNNIGDRFGNGSLDTVPDCPFNNARYFGCMKIDSSKISSLGLYKITGITKKYYYEKQYIYLNGITSFDRVDKDIELYTPSLAYTVDFNTPGLPVCSQPTQGDWANCPENGRTDRHKFKIKFLGKLWTIINMTPPDREPKPDTILGGSLVLYEENSKTTLELTNNKRFGDESDNRYWRVYLNWSNKDKDTDGRQNADHLLRILLVNEFLEPDMKMGDTIKITSFSPYKFTYFGNNASFFDSSMNWKNIGVDGPKHFRITYDGIKCVESRFGDLYLRTVDVSISEIPASYIVNFEVNGTTYTTTMTDAAIIMQENEKAEVYVGMQINGRTCYKPYKNLTAVMAVKNILGKTNVSVGTLFLKKGTEMNVIFRESAGRFGLFPAYDSISIDFDRVSKITAIKYTGTGMPYYPSMKIDDDFITERGTRVIIHENKYDSVNMMIPSQFAKAFFEIG